MNSFTDLSFTELLFEANGHPILYMIGTIIYNLFCKIYHYFVPQKDEFFGLQSMDSLDFEEDAVEVPTTVHS
jgi:hypothetical protein